MNKPRDPYDLDRPESDEEARKRAVALKAEECDDFKWLMSTKRGRRQVWRAMERAGVFRTSFSTDALVMAHEEGAKREGRYLFAMSHALPERYIEMLKENANAK
jgi:hypothetical protein